MLLQKLLPQDKVFNLSLLSMAKTARQSCVSLRALFLSKGEAEADQHSQAIMDAKNASKTTFEAMTTALCKSFITPYDREDMQELATTLYKIPKRANKIKSRLLAYDVSNHKARLQIFLDIAIEQATALEEMISDLTNHQMARVHGMSQQIHQLEDRSDDLLAQHLTELTDERIDIKDFILMKNIFDLMEKMTDAFRDASDLALRIILKHS
jgi:uncharacterized protein Yka (UPF0111/DUF47 family)